MQLPHIRQGDGVGELFQDFGAEVGVGGIEQAGVGGDDLEGVAAGHREEVRVEEQVGEVDVGAAGLGGADHLAHAAEFEVFFGDFEAAGVFGHGLEAGDAVIGALVGEEDAGGAFASAADAAAELVELREAEAVGLFDDHGGGVGDIDADFDDGGGDEDVDEVLAESFHDVLAGFARQLAVDEADAEVFQCVGLEFSLDRDGGAEGRGGDGDGVCRHGQFC
jgi:hypothetical protein